MNALDYLNSRSSTPAKFLSEPAPSDDQLNQILQTAMSVPDHSGLQPFRFLTIQGDARIKLAEVFERAIRTRDAAAGEPYFKKQYQKPLRSPLIICVICNPNLNSKVPLIEQQLSAGCAAQNIMLACHTLKFGACWLTGDNAYDFNVKEALGLGFDESITGFIYVGSIVEHNIVQREDASQITTKWINKLNIETAI